MRKVFILLCVLALSLTAFAGTSAVTATITDSDGQTWNNGTFLVTFVAAPGRNPNEYNVNGVPFQQSFSGVMNSSGVLSVTLTDISTMSPSGGQWRFQMCPNASATCSAVVTNGVIGATPNLSIILSAGVTAPRFSAGQFSYGYLDVEVSPTPQPGGTYFNVVSGLRLWNGSAWTSGSGGFIPGTAASGAQGVWSIQTGPCGSNPNCTQIFADGKYVIDAVTNSTTTITSATAAFTQADVGKSVWAVQRGATYPFSAGTLICGNTVPVPTITTVNSATSITISGSNCTASQSNVILVYGHKDGATLHALNTTCANFYFPQNTSILVDDSFFTVIPPCASLSGPAAATGAPNSALWGGGPTTQFIITPDFNWADCTGTGSVTGGVCIGSGIAGFHAFLIWGSGPTSASVTNCANSNGKVLLAHSNNGGIFDGVNISGVCVGSTLTGAELNSLDDIWTEGGVQNVGLTGIVVSSKAVYTQELDNLELGVGNANAVGEKILSGAQLTEVGTFLNATSLVQGSLTSRNSHFVAGSNGSDPSRDAVNVASTGTWQSDGDYVNIDSSAGSGTQVGVLINSGGTVVARNTQFSAAGGANVSISNGGGTFIDHGGNTSLVTAQIQGAFYSGDQILWGSCTGVASPSATITIYPLGTLATTTCTAAVGTGGYVAQRAFSNMTNLRVASTATTVNVVATVFVNHLGTNSATTLTCTITASTLCSDPAHHVSVAVGDIITIQFTTGAAETAANLTAQLVLW